MKPVSISLLFFKNSLFSKILPAMSFLRKPSVGKSSVLIVFDDKPIHTPRSPLFKRFNSLSPFNRLNIAVIAVT